MFTANGRCTGNGADALQICQAANSAGIRKLPLVARCEPGVAQHQVNALWQCSNIQGDMDGSDASACSAAGDRKVTGPLNNICER